MGNDLRYTRKTSNIQSVKAFVAREHGLPIATAKGKADVTLNGGFIQKDLGNYDVEINLYLDSGNTSHGVMTIELIVPELSETTSCVVFVENNTIAGIDGWYDLGEPALELLGLFGICDKTLDKQGA
jgi:hypothetical protein